MRKNMHFKNVDQTSNIKNVDQTSNILLWRSLFPVYLTVYFTYVKASVSLIQNRLSHVMKLIQWTQMNKVKKAKSSLLTMKTMLSTIQKSKVSLPKVTTSAD